MGFGRIFKRIVRPIRRLVSKPKGPSAAEIQARQRADRALADQLKRQKDREAKEAKLDKAKSEKLSSAASPISRSRRRGRRAYRLLLSSDRNNASSGIKGSAGTLGG
jgi:hypothetical protein